MCRMERIERCKHPTLILIIPPKWSSATTVYASVVIPIIELDLTVSGSKLTILPKYARFDAVMVVIGTLSVSIVIKIFSFR